MIRRGTGYRQDIPPIYYRVSEDQYDELKADAEKAGVSVHEIARRRAFPGGPKLIRLISLSPDGKQIEGKSVAEVLADPALKKIQRRASFERWAINGHILMAEFHGGYDQAVARVVQGQLRDLPRWRGETAS